MLFSKKEKKVIGNKSENYEMIPLPKVEIGTKSIPEWLLKSWETVEERPCQSN